MLGVFGHQFAAQCERVLLGRVGNFVDKALKVNRVLIQIHATPEARWHVRIAHRVIHQQRGEGVAN